MRRLSVFLSLLLTALCGRAQTCDYRYPEDYYRYLVTALAHDSMEGRLPGTKGEKDAARLIAAELKKAGCRPAAQKQFLFPFDYRNPDSILTSSSGNVIGIIRGKSKEMIVIGAHYDHIGWGKHHSNAPFNKAIHNGADDNASGVALLLHLANWAGRHKKELQYTLVFAAFAVEEDGLYGSKRLLAGGQIDTAKIACYLNFDMVGRLSPITPVLKTEGLLEYPYWNSLLPTDSLQPFQVRKSDPIFKGGSDNYNFELAHIPSLALSTGLHDHYHKPDDDAERINWQGMLQITAYVEKLLENMQRCPDLGAKLKKK